MEAVGRALKDGGSSSTGGGGDVLVFLPGVGEIRAVERLLEVGCGLWSTRTAERDASL